MLRRFKEEVSEKNHSCLWKYKRILKGNKCSEVRMNVYEETFGCGNIIKKMHQRKTLIYVEVLEESEVGNKCLGDRMNVQKETLCCGNVIKKRY